MAQIVTITNPLTGQPAQVDQLDHTAQQIDDGIGFESTDYPGCYYRTVNGVVEWLNPPMIAGKEYRTTERYLGKPVYVKMIEAGFNPAGTVKETSDKTVSASGLVRFSAVRGAWSLPSFMYGGKYEDAGDIQVSVQGTSDGIHVLTWSKTRDMTSATAMVSVYYTKN